MVTLNQKISIILLLCFIIAVSCQNNYELDVYNSAAYQNFSTSLKSQSNKTWENSCMKCHNINTEYIGYDVTDYWNKTAKKGIDTLYKHVYEGYKGDLGIMPPRGSCYDCSEHEIRKSIYYLFYLSEKYNKDNN